MDQKEAPVFERETPETHRAATAAKALSIGLLVWMIVGGLAILGVFTFLQSHG